MNAGDVQGTLQQQCVRAGYVFGPEIRAVYLQAAKAAAAQALADAGDDVPADFLGWVESDPLVEASVYGVHEDPAAVLRLLYSLQLDLGKEKLRAYRQLALAAAIVGARTGVAADLTPREPLTLQIGGDPRLAIDTKVTDRELDINDHIINFLNENEIEETVVVGYKEEEPPLQYDSRGVAIPAPTKKGKAKKVPVTEVRMRSLYAADVLSRKDLQGKFNSYMREKGFPVEIDCGDGLVHWKSREMIRSPMRSKINEAFVLFRTAYEEKGLLPKERDPIPSLAERCGYLIRNNEFMFPPQLQEPRQWPRFPLTAPWPLLMMLVNDSQPLREREERWEAFRDDGVFKTYGEYIGSVAQQFDMQSARRIKPYPFTYGTIQMMLKDGGVCGTMGNISARTHNAMGVPACTAGQPGHCAVVMFRYDPSTAVYACKGAQYATGGDDKTTPHVPWFLGPKVMVRNRKTGQMEETYPRKPMVYQQSLAWAINDGLRPYLDSMIACRVFGRLPEPIRKSDGLGVLTSTLDICPYNIVLINAAQDAAATPQDQIAVWEKLKAVFASRPERPGQPTTGLYPATIKRQMFEKIASLPLPSEKTEVEAVLSFLRENDCDNVNVLVNYRLAASGSQQLVKEIRSEYQQYLTEVGQRQSRENDTSSVQMAALLKAVSGKVVAKKSVKGWAAEMLALTVGHEKYVGHKYRVQTDPSVSLLAKLAGKKLPAESVLVAPVLRQIREALDENLGGERFLADCKTLAARIAAAAVAIKDEPQKQQWLEELAALMEGKEVFELKEKSGKAKSVADPCAAVIASLRKAE